MTHDALPPRKEDPPRAARWAVGTLFFLNGVLIASWVSRIPAIRTHLGLSHGTLGLALLGMALGALLAMPLAGWLSPRWGSHQTCRVATLLYVCMLPVLAAAPSAHLLMLALFFFGAVHGATDVAMNEQAVAVENRYPWPIMSSLHALFSLGGLAGAALGSLVASRQVAPLPHFCAVAILVGGVPALLAFPYLIKVLEPRESATNPAPKRTGFTWPSRALCLLGLIAFCTMVGEGAMADWTGIFLRDVTKTNEAWAAAGYAAFALAMAGFRFSGDVLTVWLGPVKIVRLGGALAAAGLATALVLCSPLPALFGFAAVGAGLAAVVPQVFSAAGRSPGLSPGSAVATVSTLGYLGFLLGPPLIGFVAEAVGLRSALWIIVGTSAVLMLLAPQVGSQRRGSPHTTEDEETMPPPAASAGSLG